MINQSDFFKKYNIKEESFVQTEIQWQDLFSIYEDFEKYRTELEPSAIYLFNTLMKSPNVHSVRYRIKDAEHLIEKIIRKKIEDSSVNITLDNYKEEVKDLIGLRALHLYKDDWAEINDYIKATWNLTQKPIANYRSGDSTELIEFFKNKDCDIKEHKYGYRSIHYLIETQPAKKKYYAEIQVRTIFEEAWAEIDHDIRYPYDLENQLFFQFLLILNRLAGSADEMGSYIKLLKRELTRREIEFDKQISEKSNIISDLETKIEKLNLQGEELVAVKADLNKLRNQKLTSSIFEIPDLTAFSKLPELGNLNTKFFDLKETFKQLQSTSNPITATFPTLGSLDLGRKPKSNE